MAVRSRRDLYIVPLINVVGARRSHVIFADICWRPFDLRFRDLLDNMRFHAEVIKTEIEFANHHTLRGVQQKMSKAAEKLDKLEAALTTRSRNEDKHRGIRTKRNHK